MAEHQKVAMEIQRLIRQSKLAPGDPLPSERELTAQLRVSYGMVRMANDYLCRKGVIHREHGRGTYLAQPKTEADPKLRHRRLGLLYVDLAQPLHPYSQALTFGIQRVALQSGYELIVEQMRTDELLQGKVPEMVRRRSVDAVILDGRVREPHIRFMEDQHLLFVVAGNTPLDNRVPQVRVNEEGLAHAMTRELLRAGRRPVWFDFDPGKGELWHVDLESFRGYAAAMQEFDSGAGPLHLCSIEPDTVSKVAAQLTRGGLENAAVIVRGWASAMLPAALALHSPRPQDILILPGPYPNLAQTLTGPNVALWAHTVETDDIAEHSVAGLLALLDGKSDRFSSLTMDLSCQLSHTPDGWQMDLKTRWVPQNTFEVVQYGTGRSWKVIEDTQVKAGTEQAVGEKTNNFS